MTDLADFLLARIAEDESFALGWGVELEVVGIRKRWVADVYEANRRIVELHRPRPAYTPTPTFYADGTPVLRPTIPPLCQECSMSSTDGTCETLYALAATYADHPDYRQWWTP